ncbi:MAG: proteasome assembly chaperone family protein, partial [Candidatus Micrarchaeota archaeon]|nr:proteasome assembly chaperone family protein [Candidatus Micrarchaeota archaeon]
LRFEFMAVQFHMLTPLKMKNPVLIEGFPGLGLVGTISASYLIDKLKMDFVGYITSEQFPPLAAIHNHQPMFPARIYASKRHNLIVLISEFIVPLPAVYELSDKIRSFAKENNVRQIVSLGGITLKGEPNKVYAIASSEKLVGELERHHQVQLIKEGATTGVTGVLLAQGAVENFPVVSFLAQAHEDYMDPRASATVLEVLKSYLSIEFDTSALDKEAATIEAKMKELMAKAKEAHAHYKKTAESAAPNLGPMYG